MTEKEFIENPEEWPKYPWLPLMRREDMTAGFIVAGNPTKVLVGNLYRVANETIDIKTLPVLEYTSIEELLKTWRID